MDADQAEQNLAALDRIREHVVTLRDAEEGVSMRGDLDDLLLPIDQLRKMMAMRGEALGRRLGYGSGGVLEAAEWYRRER